MIVKDPLLVKIEKDLRVLRVIKILLVIALFMCLVQLGTGIAVLVIYANS